MHSISRYQSFRNFSVWDELRKYLLSAPTVRAAASSHTPYRVDPLHQPEVSSNMATRRSAAAPKAPDAVSLLKADHRQVKEWFAQFEASRSAAKKKTLATQICNALTVHTKIEEEIFYPAFLTATRDADMHHEAIIEHDGAKKLIAKIEQSSPADEYYDSMVHVLAEMIKHHVKEEEQPDGMFAEARGARKMDLEALGQQMFERKQTLTQELARK
jgi:hypothetical protein